jgi:hypothetical protein
MLHQIHNPIIAAQAGSVLASRAMLRGVRISLWDGRKLDKQVSAEVTQAKNAKSDAGRFNKQLVPLESLARLKSAANACRAVHARYTLPWTDNGLDILPASSVMAYDADMSKCRQEWEAAVESFCVVYPSLVDSAPARLGDMFNASEFPTTQEVRSRFSLRIRTLPIPDSTDFRVDMSESQARQIRSEIEANARDALDSAMKDAWQRVADVCGRMVERLNAYKPSAYKGEKTEGRFTDSLVENVRDLVAVLPSFNLTGDAALSDVCGRLKSELCTFEAQELRDDSRLREQTAKAAESILADVSAFLA